MSSTRQTSNTILTAIGIILLVGIFLGLIPKIATRTEMKRQIRRVPISSGEVEQSMARNSKILFQEAPAINKSAVPTSNLSGEGDKMFPARPTVTAGVEETDVTVVLTGDNPTELKNPDRAYNADFTADYAVKNRMRVGGEVSFYFPFPPNLGTLSEVELLVGNSEPENVEYNMEGITFWDNFKAGEEKKIKVRYQVRGMNSFHYGLEHGRRLRRLAFKLTVKGAEDIRLPADCLVPTSKEKKGNTWEVVWNKSKLITSSNIGVDLVPKRVLPAKLSQLASGWVVLLLPFFLISIWLGARSREVKIGGLGYFFLSLGFLIFFPLPNLVSEVLTPFVSFILSFVLVLIVIIIYLSRLVGLKFAMSYAVIPMGVLCGLFPLAIGSVFPKLSSIFVVIGIVLLFAYFMVVSAKGGREVPL
ncbi:MAG: hypothetical protein AB1393_13315 [Candidatus Edwardsbacteria bacterium]